MSELEREVWILNYMLLQDTFISSIQSSFDFITLVSIRLDGRYLLVSMNWTVRNLYERLRNVHESNDRFILISHAIIFYYLLTGMGSENEEEGVIYLFFNLKSVSSGVFHKLDTLLLQSWINREIRNLWLRLER